MSAKGHFIIATHDPAGNTLPVLELSSEDWRLIVTALKVTAYSGKAGFGDCNNLATDIERDVVALLPETV